MSRAKFFSLILGLLATVNFSSSAPVNYEILSGAEALKPEYDYVIVGGGTSGLTVADRLTEDGKCKL